jgi:hypothetical protein
VLNLSGTSSFGDEPKRKRHYGTWTIIIVVIFIAAVSYFGKPEPEKPALDYSRPVYTDSYAIVCPLGLLLSVRADVQKEITDVFFGLHLSLSDKAKEFGCEELVRGLKVDAVHMSPPFDSYVQINGTLFTTPANLYNSPPQ